MPRSSSFLILFGAAALLASSAHALTWPLCEDGGTVWVTERPQTEPAFPGANLWFFCEGQLNILGDAIGACVPTASNTTICVPQVANTICELLGYERAFEDDLVVSPAAPGEPVITLTGKYCLRKDVYSETLPGPQELAAIPGETCDKISKLTCVRTLNTMAAAASLGLAEAEALNALRPTPAVEDEAGTAEIALNQATAARASQVDGSGPVGRKLMRV